jgi:hypothetical protein
MLATVVMSAMGDPLPSAVWPPPVSASCSGAGAGSAFSSLLSFHFSGHGESSSIAHNASARYLPILTEGSPVSGGEITSISVFVGKSDEKLGFDTDYSYSLSVNGSEVSVRSNSPFGVAYGLETLSQFIVEGANGAALQCEMISVTDEPAFAHRGLSIDSARRFYPVDLIKQTLRGLEMTKQNVLHLHLSDSPCWRVESKLYPQLTRTCPMVKGDMNEDGMFYSQTDIADIVEFARVRGIRVIPEFDIPGRCGGVGVCQVCSMFRFNSPLPPSKVGVPGRRSNFARFLFFDLLENSARSQFVQGPPKGKNSTCRSPPCGRPPLPHSLKIQLRKVTPTIWWFWGLSKNTASKISTAN